MCEHFRRGMKTKVNDLPPTVKLTLLMGKYIQVHNHNNANNGNDLITLQSIIQSISFNRIKLYLLLSFTGQLWQLLL